MAKERIGGWTFRLAALLAALLLAVPAAALRGVTGAPVCEAAAQSAAARTGVPLAVLRAISLTETGRKQEGGFGPWPWTVNMEGAGAFFDTPGEAMACVAPHFARGARSFDVGCFQLNYRWHGEAFASIEAMFEPEANALCAANFLRRLYEELGDWTAAAGAYHSRTPQYAERYLKIFERYLATVADGTPLQLAAASVGPAPGEIELAPRVNLYPLLKPGGESRGMGSLVPMTSGSGGFFAGHAGVALW